MKRLSSRFHLALGLSSLLLSIVLLAIYLGLVPDRDHAVRASRATLAETIAVSCSALLDRGDAEALRETLGFILMRNPEILSAGVRTARGVRASGASAPKTIRWRRRSRCRSGRTSAAGARWSCASPRSAPRAGAPWCSIRG